MNVVVRTAVALGPGADPEVVQATLFAEPAVSVVDMYPASADAVAQIGAHAHDALLVACAGESDEVLEFIAVATADAPHRPIVVLHEGGVNGFVAQVFAAGADDLVSGQVSYGAHPNGQIGRELAFAFEKALARRSGNSAGRESAADGQMIVVLGPKGGTGKTLSSCNLSAALASAGQRAVLVDLDLQFGDVGLSLGLSPERTIYDLATAPGSLDAEKVTDFLVQHSSGVRALLAPRQPDHAGAVTVPFLRELFATLRQMSDVVIVDTPPGFTPEVIAAIDCSSSACVVAMLDALSLKNTKLGLETLELMEYDRNHIKVVLNRADSRVGVTPADVTELLGREPDVLVPSDRAITRSVNEALPVVLTNAHADAREAFETLAAGYLPASATVNADDQRAPVRPRRRIFRRLDAKAS
jgi:pilus assembly protein CpaE